MHITLGPTTIDSVTELDTWVFPAAEMFPQVTHELYPCGQLDMRIATYLVRTPALTILVDAGNGNDKERPFLTAHAGFQTHYLERLSALVPPEEIDVVVCTHLHPDHCGGQTRLVDGEWKPAFRNARHLVFRDEYEWFKALYESGPAEGPEADLARCFADSVLPVAEAGLLELIDLPSEITPGVTLRPTPGHTAGHLVVEVTGGAETAVISGDVLHHPFQFGDLTLAHSGDADPRRAAASRRELCAHLAETGGTLLPAHFHPGRIRAGDDGFRYEPLPDGPRG